MYQQLPPSTDPVPPSTNKYRPLLTHYHHVSTSTAFYWPSTTKYQQVSPHTDPVTACINQCRDLLTQYHYISTSTAPYWPSTNLYLRITDFCTFCPGSCLLFCISRWSGGLKNVQFWCKIEPFYFLARLLVWLNQIFTQHLLPFFRFWIVVLSLLWFQSYKCIKNKVLEQYSQLSNNNPNCGPKAVTCGK